MTSPAAQRLTWSHQIDLTWCFGTEADKYFYFKKWSTSKTFHFALVPVHRILRENSLNNNNKIYVIVFSNKKTILPKVTVNWLSALAYLLKVMCAWLQIDTATENQSQNIPGRLWSSATFFSLENLFSLWPSSGILDSVNESATRAASWLPSEVKPMRLETSLSNSQGDLGCFSFLLQKKENCCCH